MLYEPTRMSLAGRKRGETALALHLHSRYRSVNGQKAIILSIYALYDSTLETNPFFSSIFRDKDIGKIDKFAVRKSLMEHGYIQKNDTRVYTAEGISHTLEYRI